ncbi:MAG: hypothetical protein HW378_3672 [Anaerolineales bacterium]|jgi:hypothetical protein|nr:hypothetical protein [Anaerolineales bacterium]MBM2851070.1 hypothetical protein [Anaerolineales bacterium]
MPPILVIIIVGLLILYIGYLRLQLYINRRVLGEIEKAAIVVPVRIESGSKTGLFALGLLLVLGTFVMMMMAK